MDIQEAADRVIAAHTAVVRWGSADFKRQHVPFDLSSTQFAILALLDRSGTLTASALANRLDLTVPTVVRAVDALERKGLVSRTRGDEDHREVRIACTDEGRHAREEVGRIRHERTTALLSKLSATDLEALVRGYEALARAMHQERQQAGGEKTA